MAPLIPVVISTRQGREAWLNDLTHSINQTSDLRRKGRAYTGWEIEAIRDAYSNTDWPEFLFLQDSTRVKHPGFWDMIDRRTTTSHLLMPRPNCYMALYQREVLDEMFRKPMRPYWIPDTATTFEEQKEWALAFEDWFIRDYIFYATGDYVENGSDLPAIFPELTDANSPKREMRHGELRMIMENDLFEKAKGTFR